MMTALSDRTGQIGIQGQTSPWRPPAVNVYLFRGPTRTNSSLKQGVHQGLDAAMGGVMGYMGGLDLAIDGGTFRSLSQLWIC